MAKHLMGDRELTIYRVNSRLKDSSLAALNAISRELWQNRWHISTRYRLEFKARFSQTFLGMFWQFIEPLLPISAYALLAYIAVFPERDDIPALVYISVGITVWMLMTDMVTRQIAAIQSNKGILNRSSFPLAGVLASAFAQSAFETLVRVAAVIFIYGFLIGAPPLEAILVIPMLVPMLIFSAGLGMLLSVLNIVYRDVESIVQILFRYGFFLSLTIFPLPDHPIANRLLQFNPFAVFIEGIRNVLVTGEFAGWLEFGLWSGVGCVLLIVGAKLVYVMEPRIRGFL